MKELSHYIYVNRPAIDQFSAALGIKERRRLAKVLSKVTVSLLGLKLETNREYIYVERPLHDRIEEIIAVLRSDGLLLTERPSSVHDAALEPGDRPIFCLEDVTAVKVFLPKHQTGRYIGNGDLSAWIAEPEPSELSADPQDYRGTVLILSQTSFDDEPYQIGISGCSALQALLNGHTGLGLILEPWMRVPAIGNYVFESPTRKLERIGGICSLPRRIRVLYRLRYMTDEQDFSHNGKPLRVCDLLAYPLFISSAQ